MRKANGLQTMQGAFLQMIGRCLGSPKRKAEQSKRFIETTRNRGVDETEDGHERAFGKVGLKKPKRPKTPERKK